MKSLREPTFKTSNLLKPEKVPVNWEESLIKGRLEWLQGHYLVIAINRLIPMLLFIVTLFVLEERVALLVKHTQMVINHLSIFFEIILKEMYAKVSWPYDSYLANI